jgi:hypothetical protein
MRTGRIINDPKVIGLIKPGVKKAHKFCWTKCYMGSQEALPQSIILELIWELRKKSIWKK